MINNKDNNNNNKFQLIIVHLNKIKKKAKFKQINPNKLLIKKLYKIDLLVEIAIEIKLIQDKKLKKKKNQKVQ